jgi:hypothetical protein
MLLHNQALPSRKQRDAKNAQADGMSLGTLSMAGRGFGT